jgi:hypothetical protein
MNHMALQLKDGQGGWLNGAKELEICRIQEKLLPRNPVLVSHSGDLPPAKWVAIFQLL